MAFWKAKVTVQRTKDEHLIVTVEADTEEEAKEAAMDEDEWLDAEHEETEPHDGGPVSIREIAIVDVLQDERHDVRVEMCQTDNALEKRKNHLGESIWKLLEATDLAWPDVCDVLQTLQRWSPAEWKELEAERDEAFAELEEEEGDEDDEALP